MDELINKIREYVVIADESGKEEFPIKQDTHMTEKKVRIGNGSTHNTNISDQVLQAPIEIKSQTISSTTNTQSVMLPVIPTNFKLNKKFKHVEKVHNK